MRTRVIQREPGRREPGQPKEKDQADPAAEPTHRATPWSRAGRWSTRHRKTAIVLLLAAFVLIGAFLASRPGGSDAAATGAPTAAPDFAAIDRFVEAEMDAQRIPGLALGIVEDDRIVHIRGFGKADASGRAVSPETPFIIGSLSKSVTALAIMQLVEARKVELDAPVQRYIPWFRVADESASAGLRCGSGRLDSCGGVPSGPMRRRIERLLGIEEYG